MYHFVEVIVQNTGDRLGVRITIRCVFVHHWIANDHCDHRAGDNHLAAQCIVH